MAVPLWSATRRNHAIEHATIAVLFRRRGRVLPAVARSDHRGFFIRGPFSVEEVESAAAEAIQRLSAGEHHLAVTHLCGTNIAVTGIFAGAVALTAGGKKVRAGWPGALGLAMVAAAFAGRAGLFLQRHVTIDADIHNASLGRVRAMRSGVGRTRTVRVSISY
ncbi:MAG: DUF6391 domain-containing protein [Dehalococcoidia bacterium]